MERMSYENEIRRMRITLIFDNFPQTLTFCEIFTSKFHSVYRGLSKIMGNCQRFGTHFSQIVEDCVSDCQKLGSSRSRSCNSFSSFNPPHSRNQESDETEPKVR